jgi:small nuclear ribonucleoprotein (snRNP)-like protein
VLKGYDALLNLVLDSAVGMHSFMRPFIDKKRKAKQLKHKLSENQNKKVGNNRWKWFKVANNRYKIFYTLGVQNLKQSFFNVFYCGESNISIGRAAWDKNAQMVTKTEAKN